MIFPAVDRAIFSAVALSLGLGASLFAQSPFQFPTANHALYEIRGKEFQFAPNFIQGVIGGGKLGAN